MFRTIDGIKLTLNADGNRLNLGNFDENGLNCDNYNWDDNRNDNLGVFPLMVCKTKRARERPFVCEMILFKYFYPPAGHFSYFIHT